MQPVQIVAASPAWAQEFAALAARLRACLGALALRIDHIGSTSVPGLDAKDIIDVQVTVAELDVDRLVPAFALAGFDHRPDNPGDHRPPGAEGPDQDWAKLFFAERTGRPTNVHVRVMGRPNQRYALLFRDYLRAHPAAAAAYAELKRRLAVLGISRGVYADVKDPACDIIMAAAQDWAGAAAWQPGPSDG
jgi:GrpB-like predicted nucleotidyltransferase (UPF0157 family)